MRMARSRSFADWSLGAAGISRIFFAAAICSVNHNAGAGRIFSVKTLDTISTALPPACKCKS